MPLLSRSHFPPGGFPYREPSLNWSAPADGAPFDIRASQIQAVRVANPSAGLNPSLEACADALDLYTCTRLRNAPRWCVSLDSPVARAAIASRRPPPCAGCGAGRRRAPAPA